MQTQRKKRRDGVEEYWENMRNKRKERMQLSSADLKTLKILVQDNFSFLEARLLKIGFPLKQNSLYIKIKDKEHAMYYPNNVYKIFETCPLKEAIETICEVISLILPESKYYKETHPHNTDGNWEILPTPEGKRLIVPNGRTRAFGRDYVDWSFAFITNFTFFYKFNGILWAKNIQDIHGVQDYETYYRLDKEWVEASREKFGESFMSVINSLTKKYKILREQIDPDTISFDPVDRDFFEVPSNGY